MPPSAEASIESVGAYLREHAPAPLERLKALHDWALFGAACDAGYASGCNGAGAMYALGRGVPRDFDRARSLFRAACDDGEKSACTNLGLVSMVAPNG